MLDPSSAVMRKASCSLCICAAIAVIATAAARSAPPAEKGAPPAGKRPAAPVPAPAAEVPDDHWEERKMQAREDVEYLEALRKAEETECREAELRNKHALALKSDIDRQKQKGYAST